MSTPEIRNSQSEIRNHRWHFIGIGGAGMAALASALLDQGAAVSGSDMTLSDATRELEARGALIFAGHSADNLGDATRVVVTAALSPDNLELLAAQERGIPIIKRAALLGELMDLRRGVAVAGTHGKTTTSSMVAWVLAKAGRDPSYMVGGNIRGLGSGGHWGRGAELVAEADEYDRSFLQLRPAVAVITNIESDHLEYYGTEEAIDEAFFGFAMNVQPGGVLLVSDSDPRIQALTERLEKAPASFRVQFYGVSDASTWQARDIETNPSGGTSYAAYRDGEMVANMALQVPGKHNALNSLAALAACVEVGVDAGEAATLLGEFLGAERRFEVKGEARGITVVDDYAHHPTEIAATLQAARQRYPDKRLVVVFQPHTYTRTRDFLDDFARSLSAADLVFVTEIYASRERDTLGMSGQQIVEKISGPEVHFVPTLDDAASKALDILYPGDVLLTMGAGDVWKVGATVLAGLERRAHDAVIRTGVTLRIWGKGLDPETVTSLLGKSPSVSFKTGERFGKDGKNVRKQGHWSLRSEANVVSSDLETHIAWILDQTEPASDQLKELIQTPGVQADLFCFWESGWLNSGLTLSPAIMGRIAALNLALDIDIYFAF